MSQFKSIFEKDIKGVYPDTFTGLKSLKTADGWMAIVLVYVLSMFLQFLSGKPSALSFPSSWISILLSLFMVPLSLNIAFSVPMKDGFKCLKKFKSFFAFSFVTEILFLILLFLMTFLSAIAGVLAGVACFIFSILLMLVLLFYVVYKIAFAPAYILIGYDIGGIESIRESINFTKKNKNSGDFYVKWLFLMLIVYGFSKLLPMIFKGMELQIAVYSYQFFLSILEVAMASSITIFVGAYEDWQKRRFEDMKTSISQ